MSWQMTDHLGNPLPEEAPRTVLTLCADQGPDAALAKLRKVDV